MEAHLPATGLLQEIEVPNLVKMESAGRQGRGNELRCQVDVDSTEAASGSRTFLGRMHGPAGHGSEQQTAMAAWAPRHSRLAIKATDDGVVDHVAGGGQGGREVLHRRGRGWTLRGGGRGRGWRHRQGQGPTLRRRGRRALRRRRGWRAVGRRRGQLLGRGGCRLRGWGGRRLRWWRAWGERGRR